MRRSSALPPIMVGLAGLIMMTCTGLNTTDVTLDITGSSLAVFSGYYETTTSGQTHISGSPPKSYVFQARRQYDIVAAQLVYAGTGTLTARLVSDGVTRDSATIDAIGAVTLSWTPR